MAKRQKLTNSSDETSLANLLSGDLIFTIPYFQRPYKWKPQRLVRLQEDILKLVDQTDDNHFLGAVIIHGRRSNPSDPDVYEVIDGQQRVTTVFLYLCATVKILCRNKEYDEAAGLFLNYRAALRFFSGQAKLEKLKRVRDIYTALLDQISVVQIDVFDPINGPKIFDSLNSRQEPMTTGDLVRNEIFSRVADHKPDEVESLDHQYWQPFYKSFGIGDGSLFDDYFFPFGLIKNQNLKKSDVYSHLRDLWKDIDNPALIIQDLSRYQDAFLDLENGSNEQKLNKTLHIAVRRISEITPTSTYPFLMQLLDGLKKEVVSEDAGLGILSLIESFLVRRALCGHEPTGLHAVYKRLWDDCGGEVEPSKVEDVIRSHKTVAWPNSKEVKNCVLIRPLYGSTITRFVLKEWNRKLGGDVPSEVPWIEHVLPETMSEPWKEVFSAEQHEQMKHRLANLIPLSQQLNQGLGNDRYEKKRKAYIDDSMFKAAREFAKEYVSWTPKELDQRSSEMSNWAVERWSI